MGIIPIEQRISYSVSSLNFQSLKARECWQIAPDTPNVLPPKIAVFIEISSDVFDTKSVSIFL